MNQLKLRIQDATRAAMKARDKPRVAALRLINADIKRVEVDERKELNDREVVAVLTRMLKQRNDSLTQYRNAGRDDLADVEQFEIDVIGTFMPEPLAETEIDALIDAAVAEVGATGMRDMGKVMARLRSEVQGRANMGELSARVKAKLN